MMAVKNWRDWDDETWHQELGMFVKEKRVLLHEKLIRRISFLIFKDVRCHSVITTVTSFVNCRHSKLYCFVT